MHPEKNHRRSCPEPGHLLTLGYLLFLSSNLPPRCHLSLRTGGAHSRLSLMPKTWEGSDVNGKVGAQGSRAVLHISADHPTSPPPTDSQVWSISTGFISKRRNATPDTYLMEKNPCIFMGKGLRWVMWLQDSEFLGICSPVVTIYIQVH